MRVKQEEAVWILKCAVLNVSALAASNAYLPPLQNIFLPCVLLSSAWKAHVSLETGKTEAPDVNQSNGTSDLPHLPMFEEAAVQKGPRVHRPMADHDGLKKPTTKGGKKLKLHRAQTDVDHIRPVTF
nr:hypothetical protein CFP56_42071 [Quercus suber]